VTAIAAGDYHSLALKNGGVLAWGCAGSANYGQCDVPPAAAAGVTAISASLFHSVALKQDGSVVAWGCRTFDQGQCSVPPAAASGVRAIAAGENFSLALKQDGSVLAWGCGAGRDFGQCSVPAEAGSGVTAISAGVFHALALKDGRVLAWGCREADAGQCTVPGIAGSGITAVAAGVSHNLVLYDPADQTITVAKHAPATAVYRTSFTVAAISSSGLPVTYSAGGACSSSGPTFTMTRPTGTCQVKYDQRGGGIYGAAPEVVESVTARPIPCTVPNVVGKRLARAKQTIAKRHCRTGKIRRVASRASKKGIVVAQSRGAGQVLPPGSKIDLAVGRGPKS
jgi:hypothetical protein